MKDEKLRLVKLVIWGATTLSITYLGYNLFSGEVMTTIDNWIATGTLTLAQISNALLIILMRVLPQSISAQTSDSMLPTLSAENTVITNELTVVKNELAEVKQLLVDIITYREEALQDPNEV